MQRGTLKKWLIVVAVVYLVFPRDLIPDFVLGPGLIDDLLVIALLVYLYRNHLQKAPAGGEQESPRRERSEGSDRSRPATPEGTFDPYEVLGIEQSASDDAIRAAYKARMNEYHPDKVAHLGEDLRKLAHEKALEIQRAYRQVRR